MLSFKQHKLCFWRFCTGSVVKNFFKIKFSHTGGAGELKFRLFLRFRYFMASLGILVVSGSFWEHLESILVAGSGSGCIQSYCPGA